MKQFYVYIMCSQRNGTLYTGITSDLARRVLEHKQQKKAGFTSKYSVVNLVYYEIFSSGLDAIRREKQIKQWNRAWKLRLIEAANPEWKNLYAQET